MQSMHACLACRWPILANAARAGLLVAGFRRFPGQRAVLMEEVLGSVLPNLPIARARIPRAFVVGDSAATCIQMASALVLQLLQARIAFLLLSACPSLVSWSPRIRLLLFSSAVGKQSSL